MSKLTRHIILFLLLIAFAACKSNDQKTKFSNGEEITTRFSSISNDSLTQIIRDIAEYMVIPSPRSSELSKLIEPRLKKYRIIFTDFPEDSIGYITISCNFSYPDSLQKNCVMIGDNRYDTANRLNIAYLTKVFGSPEKGIIDWPNAPKNTNDSYIFKILTKSEVPVFFKVEQNGEEIINCELNKYKKFNLLTNK